VLVFPILVSLGLETRYHWVDRCIWALEKLDFIPRSGNTGLLHGMECRRSVVKRAFVDLYKSRGCRLKEQDESHVVLVGIRLEGLLALFEEVIVITATAKEDYIIKRESLYTSGKYIEARHKNIDPHVTHQSGSSVIGILSSLT